jgi:hypothetical protein
MNSDTLGSTSKRARQAANFAAEIIPEPRVAIEGRPRRLVSGRVLQRLDVGAARATTIADAPSYRAHACRLSPAHQRVRLTRRCRSATNPGKARRSLKRHKSTGAEWRQRNPEGGVAVSVGTATEMTGDAGGVVVVIVALSGIPGPDPPVPALTCSLATITRPCLRRLPRLHRWRPIAT